jgi:uncharacterized delta-60 repeat protein
MAMAVLLVRAAMADAQQPWSLDPSFQTAIVTRNVNSLVLLDNGQLLASGRMNFTSNPLLNNFGLIRFNSNGSRDASFPNGPVAATGGNMIKPWADKYYIIGGGGGIQRAHGDGLRDLSFQLAADQYFMNETINDFFVYPDGSIVVVGLFSLDYETEGYVGLYNMVWLTNSGSVDLSRPPRRGGNCDITKIVQQADGKFILSGNCSFWDGQPVGYTFRVDANGVLDTTFQSAVAWGESFSITPLPDGRIIASGLFKTSFSSPDTLHMVRMMPDGSIDPTFNNDLEVVQLPWAQPLWPNEPINWGQFTFLFHQLLSDGRIVVFGPHRTYDGQLRKGIAILNSNGYLESDFSEPYGCGQYAYDSGTGDIDYLLGNINGLYEAPNGYIYVWGSYYGYHDGTTNYPQQRFISRLYGLDVGIAERNALPPLVPYPNPGTGTFTLELPLSAPASLELLDASGRLVYTQVLRPGIYGHTVQSGLPAGVYALAVREQERVVRRGRVVVE